IPERSVEPVHVHLLWPHARVVTRLGHDFVDEDVVARREAVEAHLAIHAGDADADHRVTVEIRVAQLREAEIGTRAEEQHAVRAPGAAAQALVEFDAHGLVDGDDAHLARLCADFEEHGAVVVVDGRTPFAVHHGGEIPAGALVIA
ncbi:hypothetical protein BTE48_16920, partial [Oceanospirillum multiglobuliferum]